MSEIFELINETLNSRDVAEHFGFVVNVNGFCKSPLNKAEKTPSCKIYPGNRGFYDFSAATGGDTLKFASIALGVDTWQAAQYLIEAFHLPIDTKNNSLTKQRVQELQRQREADRKRRNLRKRKSVSEMDYLKSTICICEELLASPHIQPMSDVWCWAVEQRNRAIVQANEICGIETYAADLRLPERPKEREVANAWQSQQKMEPLNKFRN